jgi:regulator of PEP synthase PpsR (kinase-PPPase family)
MAESTTSRPNYFHLHLVSDSTGETLMTVARAAAAQYAQVRAIEHVYPLVRSHKQLDRVLSEIESAPGIILFTLVDLELTERLEQRCKDLTIPCISILDPVLKVFQSYLGTEKTPRVAGQHVLDKDYFARIDALNFALTHDDGQIGPDIESADVVLIGVSRTSKTPTCIYLANRGVRAANIPLVPGVPMPPQIETLTKPLVVGLIASPERIVQIRQNRLLALNAANQDDTYIDRGRRRRRSVQCSPVMCPQGMANNRRDPAFDRRDGGSRDCPVARSRCRQSERRRVCPAPATALRVMTHA